MTGDLNYDAWRFWREIVVLGAVFGNWIYTWWVNRAKVTEKRFRALEDEVKTRVTAIALAELEEKRNTNCAAHGRRLADNEQAVARVGTELRHMPSRAELSRLADGMTQLSEKLGKVEGRLDGINRAADLMNEFLINQGGKK
mgnify:CR=1 FL=1